MGFGFNLRRLQQDLHKLGFLVVAGKPFSIQKMNAKLTLFQNLQIGHVQRKNCQK